MASSSPRLRARVRASLAAAWWASLESRIAMITPASRIVSAIRGAARRTMAVIDAVIEREETPSAC
jgi:hypothetical protein